MRTATIYTEKGTIRRLFYDTSLSLIAGLITLCVIAGNVKGADMASSEVIRLVNDARTEAGLPILRESSLLSQAAMNKATDMIAHDYFSHVSPSGVEPWFWIRGVGYQYRAAGENLAINFTDASDQHNAWMKSPTHQANILSVGYQEIGVAVVKGKIDGNESIFTVEYFGSPIGVLSEPATKSFPMVLSLSARDSVEGMFQRIQYESQDFFPSTESTLFEQKSINLSILSDFLANVLLLALSVSIISIPTLFIIQMYGLLRQEKHLSAHIS